MRTAPPAVELALGNGRRERGLVAVLYGVAAAAVAAWLAAHGVLTSWHWAWPAAAGGAWLGGRVWRPLSGRLRWDGAAWVHLPVPDVAWALAGVGLQIDLGSWMLLRARARREGRLRAVYWCGLSRREAGAHWHALRLALYHGSALPALGGARP